MTEKSTDNEVKNAITSLDDAAAAVKRRRDYIAVQIVETASSLHGETEEEVFIKSGEVKERLSTKTTGISREQRINVLGQLMG